MKTPIESSFIVSLLFNLGAEKGRCLTPRPGRFTFGTEPLPIVEGVQWVPGLLGGGGKSRPYRGSISGPTIA